MFNRVVAHSPATASLQLLADNNNVGDRDVDQGARISGTARSLSRGDLAVMIVDSAKTTALARHFHALYIFFCAR